MVFVLAFIQIQAVSMYKYVAGSAWLAFVFVAPAQIWDGSGDLGMVVLWSVNIYIQSMSFFVSVVISRFLRFFFQKKKRLEFWSIDIKNAVVLCIFLVKIIYFVMVLECAQYLLVSLSSHLIFNDLESIEYFYMQRWPLV